jgi:hypothetical protein
MEKQIVIRTIREVLGVELTPAEEQAILENRMGNVLAFLAYGRGLRELDQGNYAGAQAEFQTSVQLEPGGFASRTAAMDEASSLIDASGMPTGDLGGLAGQTGEFGVGAFGPPPAAVTQGLGNTTLGGTLEHVTQSVAPRPTTGTLDKGSTDGSRDSRDTTRDPVQDAAGNEALPGTIGTQITIVIPRPGGE